MRIAPEIPETQGVNQKEAEIEAVTPHRRSHPHPKPKMKERLRGKDKDNTDSTTQLK